MASTRRQVEIKVDQAINSLGKILGPEYTSQGHGVVAALAFPLGIFFGIGLSMWWFDSPLFALGLYLVLLTFFHFMEYTSTALYNASVLSADSFLINHSTEYTIAFIVCLVEFFVEYWLFPGMKQLSFIVYIGVIIAALGEGIRVVAMSTAKSNFKHEVADTKLDDHVLVTGGIYSVFRHPSYFGWFWYTVGTQIILFNPICIAGFAFVSYKFFKDRIEYEEERLVEFFGKQYIDYRARVKTWIPGIN